MDTHVLNIALRKKLDKFETRQQILNSPIYRTIKEWAKRWGYWKNAPRGKPDPNRWFKNSNPYIYNKEEKKWETKQSKP